MAQVFAPARRIIFSGDSLARQVFIAFACLLSSSAQSYEAQWHPCTAREPWPCHGARNCVGCGPHSGFTTAKVLVGSSSLHFRAANKPNELGAVRDPRRRDVHVVETGIWGNSPFSMAQAKLRLVQRLLEHNCTVLWLVTPQDAFQSPSGDGYYHAAFVRGQASKACATWVPAGRSAGEWRALRSQQSILSRLAGVIELDGLNGLGHAKIGGEQPDCQHYCMPGVPDLLARAVFAMLLQVSAASLNRTAVVARPRA